VEDQSTLKKDAAMSWTRVLAPVTGGNADLSVLETARAVALPFRAEVAAVFAVVDVTDFAPWIGEGYFVGAPVAALESLRSATFEAEAEARRTFEAFHAAPKSFQRLPNPADGSVCMEARLSDLVVWSAEAALGRGPMAGSFQQVLLVERRPCLVARQTPPAGNRALIAWDGGPESTRAVRAAIPLLATYDEVTVLTAIRATPRRFAPERIIDFLAAKGVPAQLQISEDLGDAAQIILSAVKALDASLLVAGAFGHPRFSQFIFGGVTRALLQAENGPALFLSH
jgi:nucleotide-binding universal stress UspA family protein